MTYGKRRLATTPALLSLLLILLSLGCGRTSNNNNNTGGGILPGNDLPISITLLTTNTSVSPSRPTTVITAAVYDQSNRGATWMISPPGFGTLSDQTPTSVTYTVPSDFSLPTTVTITAVSITNPSVTSSVQISASPVLVSLNLNSNIITPLAPQTLNPGDRLDLASITSNDVTGQGVTWALAPASGAGSLDFVSPFTATYFAPMTVSSPTVVTLTATSIAVPTASASARIQLLPSGGGPNVAIVNVDGGPVPGQVYPNGAFTSVTICNPGSAVACQTIDGILVDTGSSGLRILQSAIPLLKLPKLVDNLGNTLQNCVSGIDGSYIWGPVSRGDIYIAGKFANSVTMQVISNSNIPVPESCSNGSLVNENTPQLLGANGILGVGPEPTDCTVVGVNYCDGSFQPDAPNVYYSCPSKGCQIADVPIHVPKLQQVTNPIPLFTGDNNGVILQLPPVLDTQASITGTMIFGIGTQPNNQLESATIFTTDSNGNFVTTYKGQDLTSSFIDSGSNALFFPDDMPGCSDSKEFFCPTSLVAGLSAVNQGASNEMSTVSFGVDNADKLFTTFPGYAVFNTLAGPQQGTAAPCFHGSGLCTFDWGLPFFYGRKVFTAIDGQVVFGAPQTPWWAY